MFMTAFTPFAPSSIKDSYRRADHGSDGLPLSAAANGYPGDVVTSAVAVQEIDTLDQQAEQAVRSIRIPPCPIILTRLLREMREDDPDFDRIADLVSGDVGLAAILLKTINSPLYGLRNKVTTVHHTLTLLGVRNVAQLVVGLTLRQVFPVSASAAMNQFWETSSDIALVCAHVAKHVGVDKDNAYTYGLFRDCGIPAMISAFPDYSFTAAGVTRDAADAVTAYEHRCYGVHHAQIGFHLARSWELPEAFCKAILWHHDHAMLCNDDSGRPAESLRLIALALIAEQIYMKNSDGTDCEDWCDGGPLALACLGIDDVAFRELSDGIGDGLQQD
jgi:HD-like signal output (HDOD) protein